MPFIDTDTGEVYTGKCPFCERAELDAETQVHAMELERRRDRAKVKRMERQAERDIEAKRDGQVWQRVLEAWLQAFPGKKPSATGIKSARATKLFLRLDAGAEEADVVAAIEGARDWPYVVFGKRQKTGSKSDLADDLEDICAINRDKEFDFLRDAGLAARERRQAAGF